MEFSFLEKKFGLHPALTMAPVELIDSRVKVDQCHRAIKALHEFQSKKDAALAESELLPGKEQTIWLNVAVKKISAEKKLMPVKMSINSSLIPQSPLTVILDPSYILSSTHGQPASV